MLKKRMKRRRRTEKEKKSRRNSINLPEDLLVEILSRVPEASLARFRSTSKEWNTLIKKDERLAKNSLVAMLICRKLYLFRLDLQGIHDNNVTHSSLKDPLSNSSLKDVNILHAFHCDGLLLCTTMQNTLVVLNPCSGETISIIKIHLCSYTFALGKSTCNNEYKILRVRQQVSFYYETCLAEYELYDFTSNSWILVGETREWYIPKDWRHGTSVDGNTYWLAYSPAGRMSSLRCFDFSTERFGCVSLPPGHPLSLSVTREEQKLCLLSSRDKRHNIDVWMATKITSTGDMSWSRVLTVKRTHPHEFITFHCGMSFMVDWENKVLVCPTKHKHCSNCLHIFGEDKYIKVDLHDEGSKHLIHRKWAPTLVQIQQGSLGLGTWKATIQP